VSNPATSGSPVGYGRWNTTPGGCTVIDSIDGRELRGRYAAVTEVSTGEASLLPVSTAFHCRYRPFGLAIGSPSARVYGFDQSLQV